MKSLLLLRFKSFTHLEVFPTYVEIGLYAADILLITESFFLILSFFRNARQRTTFQNFSCNSSAWQFLTLNIWRGPKFFWLFCQFYVVFLPFLPDSCFWMIFCSIYWFESVKTIRNEEVQSKCEFISRIRIKNCARLWYQTLFSTQVVYFQIRAGGSGFAGCNSKSSFLHIISIDHDFAI